MWEDTHRQKCLCQRVELGSRPGRAWLSAQATDQVGQALAGLAVDQILTKCAAFFPGQGESTAHLVIRDFGRALHASRMLSLSKSSASIVLLSRWQDAKRLLVILASISAPCSINNCETPRNPPDDAKCNRALWENPRVFTSAPCPGRCCAVA